MCRRASIVEISHFAFIFLSCLFAAWPAIRAEETSVVGVGHSALREVTVTGELSDVVKQLPEWETLREALVSKPLPDLKLDGFREKLLNALRDCGYVFAQVDISTEQAEEGLLILRTDGGVWGELAVRCAGRYYSPEQVIAKLSGRTPGFNYLEFCRRLAAANTEDLQIDVTLKPIRRNGRLEIDGEVSYRDRLPLHARVQLSNTTVTEAKSPLQLRIGLQGMNFAHCDDTLSLTYITNGDIGGEVNAGYGSYQLPIAEKWMVSVFGSWSDSTYHEVVRDLKLMGRGFSYGLQLEHELYAGKRVRVTAAIGWRLARTRDRLQLYHQFLKLNSTRTSMPYLQLGYSERGLDRWGGRDFATLGLTGNWAGHFGASGKEAFQAEGRSSDGDFWQMRLGAARLQRFFTGDEGPGRVSLFAKVQALYSNTAVANGAREYLGGYESVRGYRESEASGDTVLSGTLELRTPLLENLGGSGEEGNFRRQVTGVLFTDFGVARNNSAGGQRETGRRRHQELLSVGLGVRLHLGRLLQAAVDYGWPINRHATPDTPASGRWHFAVQLQF